MRPPIPHKVTAAVDRISAETWNRLVEALAYAMSHPRGDSVTIRNTESDLLTALPSGAGGGNGGGGSFTLAAVVTSPAGGYGDGEYEPVTLNSDGTYTITSGGSVAAITPFI